MFPKKNREEKEENEGKNRGNIQETDVNDIILGLEEQRNKQELKANEAQELLKQAKNFYTEVSDKAVILKEI